MATKVGGWMVDAHALARFELRDAGNAFAWLCAQTYLRPIEPRSALAGVWRSSLLDEFRIGPPPAMAAAARARGDGLLVWISNHSEAQLVRVRGPTTIRSWSGPGHVDEIELLAALPSLALGTVADVGHRGGTRLTVA